MAQYNQRPRKIGSNQGRLLGALRERLVRSAGFLLRKGRSAELDEELRGHLDLLEHEYRTQGLGQAEARRRARVRLGGVTQIAEAYADQRTLPRLETLVQDARYAVRMLRRSPGFTFAALLTLALGIGATTAVFTIVHTVLLRPLPFVNPHQLVMVGDREPDGTVDTIGYATVDDYRARTGAFSQLVALRSWAPTLVYNGEAERLPAMRVSWNYFEMLGVRPALGRGFRADDDRPDHWRVLLLSDALWRRRFGGDPLVLGRSVRMNDQDYQIVGVLPPDFEPLISTHYYQTADLWAPLGYAPSLPYACRTCGHLRAAGRLAPGVTPAQAEADLNGIRSQLQAAYPTEYPPGEITTVALRDAIAGPVRPALLVLLGAVGFVMLIACANVANLLLARAVGRSREMAIRAALGAGRGRLVRQMLTETAVLGAAGGLLGVAVAAVLVNGISSFVPIDLPRAEHLQIDRWILALAVGTALLTGVIFGLVPALPSSLVDLRGFLVADPRTAAQAGPKRARHALVVADLALALVLLTGAGLMLKTVGRLMQVNPGFDSTGVMTLQFSLVGTAYREDAAVREFQRRLLEHVRALPGVEAAALAGQIPMGGNFDRRGFHIDGRVAANPAEDPSAERYSVTPDYFKVMGIPLHKGRLFSDADSTDALPVMVISQATAETLWRDEDPIGDGVRIGGTNPPSRTVVGIVGDVHHENLDRPFLPQMYLPQAQLTDSFLVLVVRASARPLALVPEIKSVLQKLDPAVPVYSVATLDELVGRSLARPRFVMALLGGFAALALLLAALGLYGVIAFTVAQRTREVAVRVALGARPASVVGLVMRAGVGTIAVGLAVGTSAALLLTRFLESLLFGVEPADPATVIGAAGLLVLVAVGAHLAPTRRALRVDPAAALRQDG